VRAKESAEHGHERCGTHEVGHQEEVEHAIALRRDHKDGNHESDCRPASHAKERVGREGGQHLPQVHSHEASKGIEDRVGTAHDERESQKDEPEAYSGRGGVEEKAKEGR
jgi:hypothetical protein